MATFTTDSTGRLVASAGPKMYIPPTQNISGSAIDAASSKTLADQATAAQASKTLGVGQKGASRRRGRRTRRRRGGAAPNLNAQVPILPEAGTIKGVSHETNHLNAVNTLNQLKADAVYDSAINAPPVKLGGRKTKRKSNGGRKHRTHRGKHRKSTHRNRRTRRRV